MNDQIKTKPIILVVDDEENIRLLLAKLLTEKGYEVITAENGRRALDFINSKSIALVIMDIKMPKIGGLEVLKIIKKQDPEALVIILTAFATIKTAVEAIKTGAFDYLTKPFEVEELYNVVERAIKVWNIMEENRALKSMFDNALPGDILCSNNSEMQKIQAKLKKIALSEHTVMISGETGTGKSLLAKAMHKFSNRKKQSFVWLNCAALPEHLIESELFGYEKGAFTGAVQQKKGQLEIADKGTLFLDEVSMLSPSAQGKLLLALQEGEFQRVGGSKPVRVDTRIIAASNQNLKTMVDQGQFRADLYYRLNVINIRLPSLNERPEDIIPLLQYFITKYSKDKEVFLATETGRKLINYHWPGNIRELENSVKQALVLCGNERWLLPEHFILSDEVTKDEYLPLHEETLRDTLLRMQRKIIRATVHQCNNQVPEAAQRLGVSVRTIYRHL